jgi:uncharacterized protein YjbJ (UPF0337 family)
MMNKDIFEGNWRQFQGQVKQTWGKLTDDDMTYIEGSRDKLIGKLQERYGWTREQANKEIDERMTQFGGTSSSSSSSMR